MVTCLCIIQALRQDQFLPTSKTAATGVSPVSLIHGTSFSMQSSSNRSQLRKKSPNPRLNLRNDSREVISTMSTCFLQHSSVAPSRYPCSSRPLKIVLWRGNLSQNNQSPMLIVSNECAILRDQFESKRTSSHLVDGILPRFQFQLHLSQNCFPESFLVCQHSGVKFRSSVHEYVKSVKSIVNCIDLETFYSLTNSVCKY